MVTLKDKTVLVTGSGQGIGRALALAVAEAGANVVIADVDGEALAETTRQIEQLGARVFARVMDITDATSADSLHEDAKAALSRVDVVVNNAAVGPERISPRYLVEKPKFWEISDQLWLTMLRVNVFGAQLISRTFVRDMLENGWGRIINITTSLDTMYRSGVGGYGPCKAALEAASRIMAQDLEGSGVTANVLVPGGPVNTRMVPAENGFPADQLIQPAQMCAPLVWLCSDEADGINGLRIIAKNWDSDLPADRRVRAASAPVAWPQLGAQSAFPTSPATS
jgi:NAD(P)-dependent dehydrogenase (short-subunit alcohol dehydrogenase family)